jgi:hypothetical protein
MNTTACVQVTVHEPKRGAAQRKWWSASRRIAAYASRVNPSAAPPDAANRRNIRRKVYVAVDAVQTVKNGGVQKQKGI